MEEYYYPIVLILHVFGALIFGGAVFFEVLILESMRSRVSNRFMDAVESLVARRARELMPWVLLVLYGAGMSMVALRYWPLLMDPMNSRFGLLLWIKIILATSVFGHFCTAMYLRSTGRLVSKYFQRIHFSVFTHIVLIVFIAKAMFYV